MNVYLIASFIALILNNEIEEIVVNLTSDFKLIGKLSSVEHMNQNAFQKEYEELFAIVNNELSNQLEASDYTGKSTLKSHIDEELEICQLVLRYPTLAYRTTVGVFLGESSESKYLLKKILRIDEHALYEKIHGLPCLLYHSSEGENIQVTNNAGKLISVSADELEEMFLLDKNGVKLEDILKSCAISERFHFQNMNFVIFSSHAERSDYVHLTKFCSSYFMFYSDLVKRKEIPRAVIDSKGKVSIIYPPAQHDECDSLKSALQYSYPTLSFSMLSVDDVEKIMETFNHQTNNCIFYESLLSNVLKLEVDQSKSVDQHTQSVILLAEDCFQQEKGQIKEIMQDLRNAERDAADNARTINQALNKIRKDMMKKAAELKNSLLSYADEMLPRDLNAFLLRSKYGDICGEIILSFLELKDYSSAMLYISMLENAEYPYTYLYKLYYQRAKGERLSSSNLEQLNQATPNSDIIIRGKIAFSNQLKISEDARNQLASLLTSECTTNELYYKACYIENVYGIDDAYKVYEGAFEQGSMEAGKRLVGYYENKEDYLSLKRCADRLIPEAALLYAKRCAMTNKKRNQLIYLHIAVAQKYEPAVQYYANMLYDELVQQDLSGKKISKKKLHVAIELFKYMVGQGVEDCKTQYGVLLYLAGNYQAAKPYLTSGINGNYYLGKMYAEGYGVSKDIDKALHYLQGDSLSQAKTLCNKLNSLKEQQVIQNERESHYNSSSSYRSSTSNYSSSSNCFITTATCQAEGKPDNCDELMAFRRYRDNVLLHSDKGKALVEEYYRIAPGIVECIQNDPKSEEIYQYLYTHYILPGYELLQQGCGDDAKRLYCEGVLTLAKRYNVKVSLGEDLLEP